MKNKKIIFVCALFVSMLAFGLSKIKLNAAGVVSGGGTNYYYAPSYIKFNTDYSLFATMEFVSPFEGFRGDYEVGIWEKNNLISSVDRNIPKVINNNTYYFDSFVYGLNDTLFLYDGVDYSLDDVTTIEFYYENVTISYPIIEYLPILFDIYDVNVDMTYYTFDNNNQLVINDFSESFITDNWFRFIIDELNTSVIYISQLKVSILNPNKNDVFGIYFYPIGEYENNGFLYTDRVLADRTEFTYYPMLTWLTDSISSFLNTPIFGNEVTIGGILLIVVCIPLVIALLKFFAGG